jgi:tetratricopeptide (TPR) repeat protein
MTEPTDLVAFVRADQRAHWHQGDPVWVEDYLKALPSLLLDTEAILELICHEMALRQERGDDLRVSEYLQRFTQLEPQLRSLFGLPQTHMGGAGSVHLPSVGEFPPPAPEGTLPEVPGYEILDELGRGGMGVVYRARQCALKRLVALKMILAGCYASPLLRTRFRTEAEAVARLQHPNVVQIYEVGEHDGRTFLALEYVSGGDLLGKIAETPQPEREAAHLVEALARAVHCAHRHGILHRDLKPHNVLLTTDGTPKITDFGLAKILDADSHAGPTQSESLIGTPCYMAPEQAAGAAKQIGVPADVYSLGAILYEMLTGRPPFQGLTLLSILEQVRNREPTPVRRLRPRVSPDLETICLRCLEKRPGNRYPSAEALADDLRRFLDGRPVVARPVHRWERLWRSARRHPTRVAVALGAVALVGLLLTAWSYFRASERLAGHEAEAKHRQFVERRDAALLYGLLAPDEGALFLGTEVAANLQTAEKAAREALALAGMDADVDVVNPTPGVFPSRQEEVTEDCYALFLVLASIRAKRATDEKDERGPEDALHILDRARQLRLQTRAYYLRRTTILERLGRHEEAKADRARAAMLPVEGALDHFLVGEERYRQGDWENAANSFGRALTERPGHFWSQFFLAVCQLKGRRWEAAKAGLNACLARQPEFVWAYLFRSFADEQLKAPAEAAADFQRALQLHPGGDARYVLHLTRGIFHFNQKELEQAADDFRAAMALKPDQYNAYLNLAQVYLSQKRFGEAEGQIAQALRLKPPAPVLFGYHVERGRNLLQVGKGEEAVRACEAASELFPSLPAPHEVRARALLALGRYTHAEWSYDQFLQKGGEATPDVFRGRGAARMRLGKYPEAAEDYTRALERGPDAELYQHRGWAHFFSDAWKLALRDFSAALTLDPAMGDAYTGRGLARVMLGEYRGAVADAQQALRRNPGTPEMMHNIACVFAQAAVRAETEKDKEDRPALALSYRAAALDAVGRTLDMVRPEERAAFWREKILPDAALAPLHGEETFRQLGREMAK